MSRITLGSLAVLTFGLASSGSLLFAWEPVVGAGATTTAGFGDSDNRIAMSSAVFGSSLYVGCYNEMTGAEVWTSANGASWTQANTDNFGQNIVDHVNYGPYSMAVFSSQLYVGTWGGFSAADDTRMFRSSTGTSSWAQCNTDGFGDSDNAEPHALVEFNGLIYAGVANYPDGAEMMRSHNGANWIQVGSNGFGDTNNTEISAMATDGTTLYAATTNSTTGVEVWATTTGLDWDQVNSDGFGSTSNQAAYAMAVFEDALYVATYNDGSGLQVWRYLAAGVPAWTMVAGGGLGDSANLAAYSMTVHNGALYLGTWRSGGGQVWRSQDGLSWSQWNAPGFGSSSNYAIMTLAEFDGMLYAGTARGSGAEVWRTTGPLFADGFESGHTSAWSGP